MRIKMAKKNNFLVPIFYNLAYLRMKVCTLMFAVDSEATVHCMLSNILMEHCTAVLLWVSCALTTVQELSSLSESLGNWLNYPIWFSYLRP